MDKFLSRKFWICTIGLASVIILKAFNRLDDWVFASLFGGLIAVYLFVEGRIDLAKVQINTNQVKINQ